MTSQAVDQERGTGSEPSRGRRGFLRLCLGGTVAACPIALTNVADTPLWAEEAGRILTGSTLDDATVKKAIVAAEAITSPASDRRGPPHRFVEGQGPRPIDGNGACVARGRPAAGAVLQA